MTATGTGFPADGVGGRERKRATGARRTTVRMSCLLVCVTAVAWCAGLAAPAAWGALLEQPGQEEATIEIAADRIDYDSKAEVVHARGKVSVAYQAMRLTAESMDYSSKDDKVAARGKVHLFMKQGEQDVTIDADEVDIGLTSGALVARSSAAAAPVRMVRAGVVLEAQSVTYDGKSESVQARGAVKLVQTDLTVTCQSMDYDPKTQGMVATGSVVAVSGTVTASADKLALDGVARKAVFTGNARTQSGRNVFTGGVITIYLDGNRIEGSEGTKLTIVPGKG